MKKYYILVFSLCLIVAIAAFNKNTIKPKANFDLFSEILKSTKSEVLEYGLRTTFSIEDEGDKECVNILNNLNFSGNKNVDSFKDKNIYTLEFKMEEVSGYIRHIKYENYGTITVDIVVHKSDMNLDELKEKVDKALKSIGADKKYFQYIKAKIEIVDITYAKDIIVALLHKGGATNIKTIDLNKGSSITAYTGYYEATKNEKGLIDFNCAVLGYESGSYLIIGTPIIMKSY